MGRLDINTWNQIYNARNPPEYFFYSSSHYPKLQPTLRISPDHRYYFIQSLQSSRQKCNSVNSSPRQLLPSPSLSPPQSLQLLPPDRFSRPANSWLKKSAYQPPTLTTSPWKPSCLPLQHWRARSKMSSVPSLKSILSTSIGQSWSSTTMADQSPTKSCRHELLIVRTMYAPTTYPTTVPDIPSSPANFMV